MEVRRRRVGWGVRGCFCGLAGGGPRGGKESRNWLRPPSCPRFSRALLRERADCSAAVRLALRDRGRVGLHTCSPRESLAQTETWLIGTALVGAAWEPQGARRPSLGPASPRCSPSRHFSILKTKACWPIICSFTASLPCPLGAQGPQVSGTQLLSVGLHHAAWASSVATSPWPSVRSVERHKD